MKLAPIYITVYERLDKLKACVESLQKCYLASESTLYILSDAASKESDKKIVEEVRAYINTITGFKEIKKIFPEKNLFTQNKTRSIYIEILERHGSIIRMEDDIVVSPLYLDYLNRALEYYKDDKQILAICSYNLPFKMPKTYRKDVYLGKRFSPWGYAIWKDRYDNVDLTKKDRFSELMQNKELMKKAKSIGNDYVLLVKLDSEGIINAGDVRFCFHQLKNNLYCIFPRVSLSKNIGFDGSGMHCGITDRFNVVIDERQNYSIQFPKDLKENKTILNRFRKFQNNQEQFVKRTIKSLIRKIKKLVKILFYKKSR